MERVWQDQQKSDHEGSYFSAVEFGLSPISALCIPQAVCEMYTTYLAAAAFTGYQLPQLFPQASLQSHLAAGHAKLLRLSHNLWLPLYPSALEEVARDYSLPCDSHLQAFKS